MNIAKNRKEGSLCNKEVLTIQDEIIAYKYM